MIWQNAWAWLGLLSLGVPIAVHLLARRQAARLPFPTLRFFQASSRVSVRRQRITDHGLLAIRLAILLAAVAALAQPFLMTGWRRHDPDATLVRAIVVDTSASMQRNTAAGGPALADARQQARAATQGTSSSRILEATDLPPAISAATTWLARQAGRREMIVISDFQTGAIDAADIAATPAGVGVRMIRVAALSSPVVTMPRAIGTNTETQATARITSAGTDATWTRRPRAGASAPPLLFLGSPDEQAGAAVAREAALVGGLPEPDATRPIAIVFPGAPERAALLAEAAFVDARWMYDALDAIRKDETIAAATRAAHAMASATAAPIDRTTVVARDASGHPLVVAAAGDVAGTHRLLVFSMADAASLLSASLIAGLSRATVTSPPLGELEPTSIPAAETARWERPATDVAPPAGRPGDDSDGRWLWLTALLLLAGEFWVRRAPRATAASPVVHDRVA